MDVVERERGLNKSQCMALCQKKWLFACREVHVVQRERERFKQELMYGLSAKNKLMFVERYMLLRGGH